MKYSRISLNEKVGIIPAERGARSVSLVSSVLKRQHWRSDAVVDVKCGTNAGHEVAREAKKLQREQWQRTVCQS